MIYAMRERGVLPIALDLPGHGPRAQAPSRGFTLDDAIAAVDEKTKNLEHYDLIGYSMGGRIALHVALTRPDRVRKLVLESASPGLSSNEDRIERREGDSQLATSIEREGIANFVKRWER
ncbi:MAG TPA: 2-succinyl-6-hydroxy-2,4-cyclohexadiene-1-carboxylate synthase, partial [Gemmatimonadetes bacterium]|nr:2-succinyl-6-hydroxy-2,4-cyclohexadiene-1-carboxylate synthase [Gemmatimonadota bacterium]